jgi:hypothetical protein
VQLSIKDNFPEVRRYIDSVGKQAIYATAVALTRTAQDVRTELKAEMRRVFDRPTAYTLNSLFLSAARRDKLTAEVWVKDDRAGSGVPATRYLLPNITGGQRGMKGFEKALQAHGYMPNGMRAVPASAIKLDSYGNVPRGTMVQILSQLRVQMTAGYESRASHSKRSKRTVRKQGVVYFALPKAEGKLKPGIYARHTFAMGSAVKPMFIFVSRASYKDRFQFKRVSEAEAQRAFPRHFETEFSKALRSAR